MLTPILVVAAAHLLQGEGVGAAAAAHPKMKADFMRAMKASTSKPRRSRKLSASTRKKFREALEGHSERSAALRKKIIEKATVLKPPGGQRHLQNYDNYNDQDQAQANDGNNYNGQAQANGYNNNYNAQAQANGYGANGYNNRNGGYGANGYNNRNGNRNRNWKNADGDDYFAVYGEWNNAFGFDAAQYSLSYHRCAAVSQFDEEVAAREDSDTVFSTKQFAVFRFCPENTCMYDPDEDPEDEEEEYARQQEEWEAWQNGGGRWYNNGQGNGQGQNYQEEEEDAQGQGQEEMAYKDGGKCMKYDDDGKCKYWRSCKSYDDDGECVRWRTCLRYDEDGECEEERLFGARGEGCQDNYGEYLVELQDYLGLMMEFQEEQFTKYCQYCEQCMYDVYMTWLANRQEHDGYWGGYQDDQMQQDGQNQNGGRRLSFEEFKRAEEERRRLDDQQDEEQDDDPQAYNGNASPLFYHVCPEYDTCSEYKYTCENGIDEHYAEYFECQEVEKDNGIVAYVGPHCAEDGFTVTLGIYQDEYCGEYIGDGTRIENFIGEEVDYEEDALRSFYNSANGALDVLRFSNEEDVCIPCRKADNPYEEYVQQEEQYAYYPYAEEDEQYQEQYNQWYQEQQQERDDDEVDYKYNEYEISAICENLYMVSARCDKNYRSYTTKSKQAKYAEAIAQEDLTCDFIDSIVMGNYNEMGGVNLSEEYLSSQPSWMANSMYAQQYGHYLTEVTPLQVFGLLVSISAVVVLLAWSHSLRESLSKRGPWAPRRGAASGKASPSEEGINRQSSGIMMGRSMSNASYYMA